MALNCVLFYALFGGFNFGSPIVDRFPDAAMILDLAPQEVLVWLS